MLSSGIAAQHSIFVQDSKSLQIMLSGNVGKVMLCGHSVIKKYIYLIEKNLNSKHNNTTQENKIIAYIQDI